MRGFPNALFEKAASRACHEGTALIHQPGFRRKNGLLYHCASFEADSVDLNTLLQSLRAYEPQVHVAKGTGQKDLLVSCYIPHAPLRFKLLTYCAVATLFAFLSAFIMYAESPRVEGIRETVENAARAWCACVNDTGLHGDADAEL